MRQAASQSVGAASTAPTARRPSKARAPCQQQPKAAIRAMLPMPIDSSAPMPRVKSGGGAPKKVARHQTNQVALRSFSQKNRNSPPSTALTKKPNSRTVKEWICIKNCRSPPANRRYTLAERLMPNWAEQLSAHEYCSIINAGCAG